jgi:hypothetical protein
LRSSSAKRVGILVQKSSRGGIVFVYHPDRLRRIGNLASVRQLVDPANPHLLS